MEIAINNFRLYLSSVISMNDEIFNLSLNYLTIKKIKKNDYFIREGNYCNHIAYINKGIFRTYNLKEGREINTCFCKENSIISSFESFVNQTVSKEYIQALEDSTLVLLSAKGLAKLYELNNKWQSLSRILTEKECIRLTDRANALSFETALKKYRYLIENQPEIIKRVELQHIASYLGISRETLSRVRSKIVAM